jgi:homopolymeric O-antigen transport system permease protein
MIARYSGVEVAAAAAGHQLDVQLTLTNAGPEAWSNEQAYAVGYQVFDAETDNLLIDGPHAALPRPIAPGEKLRLQIVVSLPCEAGRYRVLVSPLRENEAWFFEQGSPFLLIEADSDGNTLALRRRQVTRPGRLGLERLFRMIGRAFVYPVRTLLKHGSLIRSLVRRDILGRYRGSFAGLFWTVIHPLLMMLTYYFVFGVVLRQRAGQDTSSTGFLMYFLAGMVPWLAMSEAIGRAPGVILEHASFVKKLLFPVEILPVTLVLSGLFSEVFGLVIFTAAMAAFGYAFSTTALLLPLVLIPQFLLTLGLCWLLAALGVFFRDLGQIMGFVLTIWFFTTPICYDERALPQNYLWLFELNPMFVLVRAYRAIFLEGAAPPWAPLATVTAIGALVFVVGHGLFYRLKGSFVDSV